MNLLNAILLQSFSCSHMICEQDFAHSVIEARSGKGLRFLIQFFWSLTATGWLIFFLLLGLSIGIYFLFSRNMKSIIQKRINHGYKYKYGNYKFHVYGGLTIKWFPFIIMVALMPFLPNNYEELTGESHDVVYFMAWFMSGGGLLFILGKARWVSLRKLFEFPTLTVFYDKATIVYHFWGLGFKEEHPSDVKLKDDLRYELINEEGKENKKFELVSKDNKHITYLFPIEYDGTMTLELEMLLNKNDGYNLASNIK